VLDKATHPTARVQAAPPSGPTSARSSPTELGRLAAGLLDISPHDQHQPVPIKPTLRSRPKEVNSHSRPERTEQLRQTLP
jgi:hypothetical protein